MLNLSRRQRSLLAQFRSGVLPLRIETGRYRNERLDRRICEFCHSGSVEDELHFLLHCNFYEDLRDIYINPCFDITSTTNETEKLKLLFRQCNVRNTAKFVEKAFLRRKDSLYIPS